MTLRTALWLAGVPWLAWGALGCEPINANECKTDQGCNTWERCDTALGACVLKGCTTDDDCGTLGFCDGGSHTFCVLAPTCTPACPSYQDCFHGACIGRYSAISLIEPLDKTTIGKRTAVRASLEAKPNFARNDPATLQLSIMTDAGTTLQPLANDGGGIYEGVWIPAAQRDYQLRVAYAAANIQSQTIDVLTDLTAPHLTIVVPPPDRRPDDAGAGWAHDGDDQLSGAWRRDEGVTLKLTADEPLAPASVGLTLFGIGDGGTAGMAVPLSPCAGANDDCFEGYVNLSQPAMHAGRGRMPLVATANDRVGNQGIADGGINVTRVRWIFTASSSDRIQTAPAIGPTGRVYFGTANGTGNAGTLFALEATGELKWTADAGAMEASPAVGYGMDGGVETVYAAFNTSSSTVLAAIGPAGVESYRCETPYTGKAQVGLAIGATRYTEPGPVETAFIHLNQSPNGDLIALRPGGVIGFTCIPMANTGQGAFPSAVTVTGTKLFFGDDSGSVRGYEFVPGASWSVLTNWPVGVGIIVSTVMPSSVAVLGTGGLGSQGGAFSIPLAGGAPNWGYPSTYPNADQAFPAAWSNGGLVYPTKGLGGGGAKSLVRVQPSATTGESKALSSFVQSAPVVGADGTVYVAGSSGTQGRVEVFQSDLSSDWTLDLDPTGEVWASPNMDCRRDASGARLHGLATLYVATKSGRLYSIITDSNGIDTTAPWPRYQHDPRSTGNVDVPLSEFACP